MRLRRDANLIAEFAEAAEMLQAGASVAACLARYPEHAYQLEPMLESVVCTREQRETPMRAAGAVAASRSAFMSAAYDVQRERRATIAGIPWWMKVFTIFQTPTYGAPRTQPVALLLSLLILFISGIVITGSVTLAASAVPGDLLYGVKTATEDVRLFFTPEEGMRAELRREFSQRRIDEARAVVEVRRPVDNLRLQGTIESYNDAEWVVAGLVVSLDANSQYRGVPAVGAEVDGRVRAPGDGSLLLVDALITPPSRPSQPGPTATPSPSPTRGPTATPTGTDAPSLAAASVPEIDPTLTATPEPTNTPTQTPTVTSTATRRPTRTPTPTRTRTPLPTPSATWTLPPPRPTPAPESIIGYVTSIQGSVWTIGGRQVEVNGETQLINNPTVGSNVQALIWVWPDAMSLARSITAMDPPKPVEFQGDVVDMGSPWWTIKAGGQTLQVKVTAETQISGNPGLGSRVNVRATQQPSGELWADSIAAANPPNTVLISGRIDAISSSSITVDGWVISVNSGTQFVGTAEVGRQANVQALQYDDGSLIALVVEALDPTPTPTFEPTPTPTTGPVETATSEPTATPTP